MAVSESVRVRIAPSPTGFAHLGTASTALYNVLFARKQKGTFALRIDDTDVDRNRPEYEALIYESLRWLGLGWDEGPDKGGPYEPYRQSERLDIYKQEAARLINDGKAYRCYCTPEELEAERRQAQAEKRAYRYSRRCLLNPPEGRSVFAVRFKVPGGEVTFTDLVRGEMRFDADLIGDFIIVKSDGYPTYQFASPVDDARMQITHVIRGEEHLSNTPYQLMLVDALGYRRPVAYAHMPLILAADGSKLSKRKHPEANLILFRDQGYIPEALLNYLSQLDEETIRRAIPPLRTRMYKLSQAVDYLDYLWTDPAPPALDEETAQRVRAAVDALKATPWEPQPIESALEKAVETSGVSKGKFYNPLRDALTGKKVALPIHYAFALLPKEKALSRLERAA